MAFNKPCIDCGQLSRNIRCDTHTTQHNQAAQARKDANPQRKARKQALYGHHYQKQRAILKANATHCHICGNPFTPTDNIDADHLIPGDPYSPLAPAHATCNRSRGDKPIR